jgi:hypothetical protein
MVEAFLCLKLAKIEAGRRRNLPCVETMFVGHDDALSSQPLKEDAKFRGNKDGRKLCVKALMDAGADADIKDYRSKKAWQYSQSDDVRAVSVRCI